ncbi:MAG: T9SS type A sorting domain-containing protein, partial [Bacteroidales bacterium]|nr:T9SS type A sorting domain-containing protein [Bacteroidales bacterium]
PNPFRSEARVKLNLAVGAEVSYEMYDLLGSRVLSKSPVLQARGQSELKLDARDLLPGLYLLKVKVGAEMHTLKLNLIR